MISVDPEETVRGHDAGRARHPPGRGLAGARRTKSIRDQLGIMGISLGGITGALAVGIEPRFSKVCLILAGGDMGEVAWTSTEMAPLRKQWVESGGTKESLFAMLKVVDPVTYARPVAGPKDPDAQRPARRSHSAGVHRGLVARFRRAGNRLVGRRALHGGALPVRRPGEGGHLLPARWPSAAAGNTAGEAQAGAAQSTAK